MRSASFYKFSQNSKLKQLLLRTGDLHLGNANTNRFYGTGVDMDKPEALDSKHWTGENILGKVLMLIRCKLRKRDGLQSRMTQKSSRSGSEAENCEEEMPQGCVPVWEYWIHNRNSETFIYDSQMSPLSDMHPAPFTMDEQTYSCRRQYVLHQKALLFRDHEAADGILKTTDPDEMLRISMKVKVSDRETWEQCELKILVDAAVFQFSENGKLKELLLSTDDLQLGSMGRNQRYGFEDERALDEKQWRGNLAGKSLMLARDKLRKRDNFFFFQKNNKMLMIFG